MLCFLPPSLNASCIHANCTFFTCDSSCSAKLPGCTHSRLLISHRGQTDTPTHPRVDFWLKLAKSSTTPAGEHIRWHIWLSVNHLFTSCRSADSLNHCRRTRKSSRLSHHQASVPACKWQHAGENTSCLDLSSLWVTLDFKLAWLFVIFTRSDSGYEVEN